MSEHATDTPRLSVIGTGYLGAVHATAMASIGFDVVAVDVDAEKIASLSSGRTPLHEPGFDDLLTETLATGRLRFTTDFAQVSTQDVHFLCVGTPQSADGWAADLSSVNGAVASLVGVLPPKSVLVGKSTVPVGTAAGIQQTLDERLGEQAPVVVWNPEFLREGFAIKDTLRPNRIVVGAADTEAGRWAKARLREVYGEQISAGIPYVETNLATAELVKVAANAFLATKISFINAMAELCEAMDGDVVQLADALGHDSRIGRRFLYAGLGFGGGCLPKDIRAFGARAEELGLADSVSFLRWVDEVNNRRRQHVVDLVTELVGGDLAGIRVAVLGAAFKPNSDDVRDSPGLAVAWDLMQAGADVRIHDPRALERARRAIPELGYCDDLTEALRGCDVILLATEWPEYCGLDPTEIGLLVARRQVVDGRNVLDAEAWRAAGWEYRGMGRATGGRLAVKAVDRG